MATKKTPTTRSSTEFLEALKGDGRKTVPYLVELPNRLGVIRRLNARKWRKILEESFYKRQPLTSTSGTTASVLVSYCEARGIDYDVRARFSSNDGSFLYYKVHFDWNALKKALDKDDI